MHKPVLVEVVYNSTTWVGQAKDLWVWGHLAYKASLCPEGRVETTWLIPYVFRISFIGEIIEVSYGYTYL